MYNNQDLFKAFNGVKNHLKEGDLFLLDCFNPNIQFIVELDMRLFFPQELDSYPERNGFNIIYKFGGFEEEAFHDNSEKQIFVCQ